MINIIVDKIIARIAKEYGNFPLIQKYYSPIQTRKHIQKVINKKEAFHVISFFICHKQIINFFQYSNNGINFMKSFTEIVFDFFQPYILQFLHNLNIVSEFTINLKNTSYTHKMTTFDEYYEMLKKYDYSPIDFFMFAFEWSLTPERYEFWKNINQQYQKYLMELLIKPIPYR